MKITAKALCWTALAYLAAASASNAQVVFGNAYGSVNAGSHPVGSPATSIPLPFTIAAGTKVVGVSVLTTGVAGRDFLEAKGSTCGAGTYSTEAKCLVNVIFKPVASGLRRGAVVFTFRSDAGDTLLTTTLPIYGIGTGPELVFGPEGARASIGGKFVSPEGVTVDAAGTVYVTDTALQKVFKVKPGGAQTSVGTGFAVPQDVAVDGAGNLYITDTQSQAVYKVTPAGVQTTVGRNFQYPSGIAVDGAGNVYVSDPFIVAVYKITPTGKQTTVGSGYNAPAGVAVDAAGNVYVADPYNAAVYKITPRGAQTTVGNGLITPMGVAVDAAGDVYISDAGANRIYEVMPGGEQTTLSTGLNIPTGLAIDGAGNLYFADTDREQVWKIDRTDAPSLTFGATRQGSTSGSKSVALENIGNAPLQFSALTYPTDFPENTSAEYDDCTPDTSLASGNACTLTIDFSPVTALGAKSSAVLKEAVRFTTDNLNAVKSQASVAVSGTEIPAAR